MAAPRPPLTTLALLAALALHPAHAVDLDTALQAAQAADPTLASASANRDAAHENIALARARLLPQVTLQNTTQHLNQTTHNAQGLSYDFDGRSRSTQLSIRQGLLRPRDWAGLQIGQLQAAQGEAKLVSTQADLWLRTSHAWLDALTAQAQQQIYAQVLPTVAQASAQETRRLALGDGTRDAAAEAAAQLAQAQAQLTEAELNSATQLAALRRVTGLNQLSAAELRQRRLPDPDALTLNLNAADGTPAPAPNAPPEAVLAHILDSNPDLLASRLNEQLAERRLRQAGADHWPTVDALASSTRAESDSTNTLGSRYRNTQLGVQVVIPLYAGGGVSAAERQATAALTAANADREALAQRIDTQFSADWSSVQALRAKLAAARELVLAANQARQAAELGIKGGLRTWGDVSAAAMQQARRQADVLSLSNTLLKTQVRLLSLLPTNDPAWPQWTAAASRLSQADSR